jgi:benzoylformate decarboxylase
VKWAYEPKRAQDVPRAIMRAYALALQPPAGPVYVSIPLDDWDQPALGVPDVRSVSRRFGPDPERIREFAARISAAANPVLVYGAEVEKSGGWDAGTALAEKLNAPVFRAPACERMSISETHPLFQAQLPPAMGPISHVLHDFDLIVVIGAPVFRYYPYVPGPVTPDGARLLQITNDPTDAGSALVGDSLLSDSKLALEALFELVRDKRANSTRRSCKKAVAAPLSNGLPLTARQAFAALSEVRPEDAIIVEESPSNFMEFRDYWPALKPERYYTYASGGLGHNAPAAVGVALAQKKLGTGVPVVVLIGDGSLQYSVQSLASAAQHKLKMIYVVPCNGEYAILKEFAVLEKTPNVPALDLPYLDILSLAKGYGVAGVKADSKEEIQAAFLEALEADGPTVITIPIKQETKSLIPASE